MRDFSRLVCISLDKAGYELIGCATLPLAFCMTVTELLSSMFYTPNKPPGCCNRTTSVWRFTRSFEWLDSLYFMDITPIHQSISG